MEISLEQAKIAHLSAQLLWKDKIQQPFTAETICKKIGYIQLDSVITIARNQDIVCLSRSSAYQEEDIWQDLSNGKLFEDWAHARCLIHKDDFSYHYGEMLRRRDHAPWWNEFLKKYKHWPDQILKQVEEQGPITVSDIEVPKGFPKATGWNKPNRRIVDYLSTRGFLLVKTRKNFKPTYDLPERIIDTLPEEIPNVLDKFWFDVNSTLKAIGPAPLHRLLQYKYIHKLFEFKDTKYQPRKLIVSAIKEGRLEELKVKGQKNTYLILPEQRELLEDLVVKEEEKWLVHLLSPWDSALWSRESIVEQYKFDYKMEVYVPKAKRKYGYYAMPILWGILFVGRVDVKLDRKAATMHFLQWSWEPRIKTKIPNKFWQALATTIKRFNTFHQADTFTLGNLHASYKKKLLQFLE